MKVLSIVMGIIYLILGILCFITPVFTANVFTYIIAAAILLAGIWMIVSYFVSQGEDSFIKKSGWSLAFGILTVILALILMFKPDFANVVSISYQNCSQTYKDTDIKRQASAKHFKLKCGFPAHKLLISFQHQIICHSHSSRNRDTV